MFPAQVALLQHLIHHLPQNNAPAPSHNSELANPNCCAPRSYKRSDI